MGVISLSTNRYNILQHLFITDIETYRPNRPRADAVKIPIGFKYFVIASKLSLTLFMDEL